MSRTPTPLYRQISSFLAGAENCRKIGNDKWQDRHEANLETLIGFLPSGSGINNGIELDRDSSTPEKLVFNFSFHHMNDAGFYDGWTDHKLTVKPSLQFGIDIRISGNDRNNVKDYLHELFQHALTVKVWWDDNDKWQCER